MLVNCAWLKAFFSLASDPTIQILVRQIRKLHSADFIANIVVENRDDRVVGALCIQIWHDLLIEKLVEGRPAALPLRFAEKEPI